MYTTLFVSDITCIFLSFLVAAYLYPPTFNFAQWLVLVASVAPIHTAFGLTSGAYSQPVVTRSAFGILSAMKAFVLATGTVVLLAFYLKSSDELSRIIFFGGSILSLISLSVARRIILKRGLARVDGNPFCVATIVDGEASFDPRDYAIVIYAGSEIDPDRDCPEMLDRLATALRSADRVVVHCPPDRRQKWVHMLKGANIQSELVAPELATIAPLAIGDDGGKPTLVVADGPLSRNDALTKRMLDIVLAGTALFVLSPALIVIAAAIKATSKGPIFFVQTRIGLGNRLFSMYKFRSMRVERGDSAGARSASRDDDRITPIGRLIRRTSIDELPQLFNVLLGSMSIVGPRPHALGSRAENKLFWEVDHRYWHRHAAKPGLTGLAQIRGFRGATERTSDLTNRLQADLEYLHEWSIWRDLIIIVQTVRVLVHRNAY